MVDKPKRFSISISSEMNDALALAKTEAYPTDIKAYMIQDLITRGLRELEKGKSLKMDKKANTKEPHE